MGHNGAAAWATPAGYNTQPSHAAAQYRGPTSVGYTTAAAPVTGGSRGALLPAPYPAPAAAASSAPHGAAPPSPPLPPGWSEVRDPKTGATYYWNTTTRETTWVRPSAAAAAPSYAAAAARPPRALAAPRSAAAAGVGAAAPATSAPFAGQYTGMIAAPRGGARAGGLLAAPGNMAPSATAAGHAAAGAPRSIGSLMDAPLARANWPPGLTDFAARALARCRTQGEREEMNRKVQAVAEAARADRTLFVKNWSTVPIPELDSAASSQFRGWGAPAASNAAPPRGWTPGGAAGAPAAATYSSAPQQPGAARWDFAKASASPNPYAPGASAPNPYAPRSSSPNPYAPHGGTGNEANRAQWAAVARGAQGAQGAQRRKRAGSESNESTGRIGGDFVSLSGGARRGARGKLTKQQKKEQRRAANQAKREAKRAKKEAPRPALDPEEEKMLRQRAARFNKGASGAPKRAAKKEFLPGLTMQTANPHIVRGNDDELDLEAMRVKGTCQTVEKRYLRLTSIPTADTVRPEPVLRKALALVKQRWADGVEYLWAWEQLKSIRQDLTVQHIKNDFAVSVYETHARIALEESDTNEFNQCQTQLISLYKLGLQGARMEFLAYRILYACYADNRVDMLKLLQVVEEATEREGGGAAADNAAVAHALRVREALALDNYHAFFRLYRDAPNMGTYLMDLVVDKVRLTALERIVKAFKPTVEVEHLQVELGFSDEAQCREMLGNAGAVYNEEGDKLDCKATKVIKPEAVAVADWAAGDLAELGE